MPRLQRIIETALYVDDLKLAGDFYEGPMGLQPMLKMDRLFAYDVGGASVLLLFKRGGSVDPQQLPGGSLPPHDGSGPIHLAFAIAADDLVAWEERLANHEIAIEGRVVWDRGGTSLYFRDPDRHLVEIATPGLWRMF